jgi:hypothetical protein
MNKKANYREQLLDPRWQKMRLHVFERDGWKCRCCGKEDKTLHAHHSHYRDGAEGPWDYDAQTIITVCATCHENEHEVLSSMRGALHRMACTAGFVTTTQLLDFESSFSPWPPFTEDEAWNFLSAVRAVIRSRDARIAWGGDGSQWDHFISLGEEKRG